MNTSNYTIIIRTVVLIACTLFSSSLFAGGYTTSIVVADYQKLCSIYKDIVNKPLELALKEMELTENVQNKLPKLFDRLFIHIITADADSRYKLIEQYAKQQNKVKWECETARLYYINEFGSP